jgi:hypothetical protein
VFQFLGVGFWGFVTSLFHLYEDVCRYNLVRPASGASLEAFIHCLLSARFWVCFLGLHLWFCDGVLSVPLFSLQGLLCFPSLLCVVLYYPNVGFF